MKETYLGPKRRVWHRLGPFQSSPTFPSLSVTLKQQFNLVVTVSSKKKIRKKMKNLPMAQTTRLASFGPVLIVANFPKPFQH
jgi:hypothetical protein